VLEERGANAAIRRSIELTRGRLGRVLLLVICATTHHLRGPDAVPGTVLAAAIFAGPDSPPSFWFAILGTVAGHDRRDVHRARS
jgi:hypothetical protein